MKTRVLRIVSLIMVLCLIFTATVFASDEQINPTAQEELSEAVTDDHEIEASENLQMDESEEIVIEPATEEEIKELTETEAGEAAAQEAFEEQLSDNADIQAEAVPAEPLNNDSSTAITVTFDKQITGSITDSNTLCWYKFTIPSSGRVTINATAGMNWIYYKLLDSDKNQIGSWNPSWDSSIGESNSKYVYDFTQGMYYFVVSKDGSYTGNYSLKFSFEASGETYPETGSGIDNTYDTAHTIKFKTLYHGQIAYNDSVDWYKIEVPSSGAVTITANAGMSWIYYKLLDDSRNQVGSWNPSWNSSDGESSFNQTIDITKGTYYFVVSKDGNTGKYSFKMTFKSAGESFTETAGGNNNSYDKANGITKGVEYKGQIAVNDTVDWYIFTLSQSANVVLTANNNMGYIYYYIYNTDRTQIKRWNPNSNNLVDSIQLEEGTYYFVTSKDGNTGNYSFKLSAEYFTDVPASHAFNTAVTWAVDQGIAAGYTGSKQGLFGVNDNITRGQVVMFLWRAANKPAPKTNKQSFSDVPKSSSFYKAIQWAAENGIVGGYKDGTFKPSDNCTRGQIAMFLWRYANKPSPAGKTQTFTDVPVSSSFFKAVQWAAEQGITAGYKDGSFGVNKSCTRGHCVTFLYRMLGK